MAKIQIEIGKNKGVVMDGRDIGTVIYNCEDDTHRKESPLKRPEDAIVLDNTN